jgi:hypothetical protein
VTIEQTANNRDRLRLLERRDALDAEMRRLMKVNETRGTAEAALSAIDAEQRAIDVAEQEAWQKWIADPQVEYPSPRSAEREDLARRRVAAANDLASAANAQRAIEARWNELQAELRTIGRDLVQLTLADVLEAARKVSVEQMELGRHLADATHERFGLIYALRQKAVDALSRDDRALADEFTRGADEIIALPAPDMKWEGMKIEERARLWAAKLR